MKKPLILITSSNVDSKGLSNITGDTNILYSDKATSELVIAAGGLPIIIPSTAKLNKKDLDSYLGKSSGVILTGADTSVAPRIYGEPLTRGSDRIDIDRDQIDLKIVKSAYRNKIPMIGICKGMQVINVSLGGTLYQDIDAQIKSEVHHNLKNKREKPTHKAKLRGKSLLKSLAKKRELEINGGHKQAIKKISKHLVPTAVASDGIIEAFEGRKHPFLVGVQFHVELRSFDHLGSKLFKRFIRACNGV